MPIKKIALAAVLGGLALFVWGAISHSVLPLYHGALHKFTNEEAVTQAIAANTPHSGTYFLPNHPEYPPGASEAERNALDEKMKQRMANGPIIIAHIRVGAMSGIAPYLVMELITDIIAALFVTLLMTTAMQLSLGMRVLFSVGVALVMVFDNSASTWNWYSAGGDYFFAETVDAVVGWALAGLVIAKLLGKGDKPGEAQTS